MEQDTITKRKQLEKIFSNETIFSTTTGVVRITWAQKLCCSMSKLISIFGMKIESKGPSILEAFIQGKDTPYTLRSHNPKM